MSYNQLMDRESLKQALRGRSCYTCRYLLNRGPVKKNSFGGQTSYDWMVLDPPHCALRTDSEGRPTEKSKVVRDRPCRHYWEKEEKYRF
jgi:hypothetical protein